MRIAITGSSGFLGSLLAARLEERGHAVCGTGGHRLGEAVAAGMFEGCDAVVHAAHDFSPAAGGRNHEGTEALLEAARAAGVRRQWFVSSHSARPDTRSRYGSAKYAIEQMFLRAGEAAVRPGLVAGPGGMFARLAGTLLRWRTAPLVEGASPSVAVIASEDFVEAMTRLIEGSCGARAWNLFSPRLLTNREFVNAVWRSHNRRGLAFAVPAAAAMRVLRLVGARSLLDSLQGQLANQVVLHRSDLEELRIAAVDAELAVERAAKGIAA